MPLLWGFSHEPLASGPGARRWRGWQDLKPVYLVALGRFLSHFLWAVRTAPGETPVFRSIRDCGRNQCFRCFCGSVGSAVFAVPLANATRALAPHCPFFFSLSFPPFYPLRIYIRSVSRLRDTKCSLQQRASMTGIIERNAENALCSDTCSFYYEGMNSLVRSFGVGICLKR